MAPNDVAYAISRAQEHEEEVEAGLRLQSPDELTPLEWAGVRGLARGRKKHEEYLEEKRKKDPRNH